MAIKANASSQGGEFKRHIGVGSFRVLGVNPTKEELSKFYGRDMQNDPVYFSDKTDKDGKAYKQVRVSFMIQADLNYEDGKPIKENAALKEPYKTTINFFIDNRYMYNNEKTKVKVIDKYARTAWVPIEQAKNHQIPVYSNGPARLDTDYKPLLHGEEELTNFIINYLNVTPIESYNRNTGQWITNSNPEDCEANLYEIQNYFKGDISELKKYCKMIPTNRVKILIGIRTDNEGREYESAFTETVLRNGSKSYSFLKDKIDGRKAQGGLQNMTFSDDPVGIIQDIHEYNSTVKETDLSKPAAVDNPFASSPADDLPFGASSDVDPNYNPFSDVA